MQPILRTGQFCLVAAALALPLFTGCSKGVEETGGDPNASAPPTAAGTESLEIAVLPKGLSHQFWLTVKAGAEAAGKEMGAAIVWQGPAEETQIAEQINIVMDMKNRGVDGMVLAACDENALVGPVQQVIDAGIPVVTIDSGVKSEAPVSFVATDNVAGARLAAETLAKLIGEQGQVGLIPFISGAATSEQREQGFKEGIAAFPNIQLVSTLYCDSDIAKAMNVTRDMMAANPELKGIFAANEPAAIGAAQAIRTAGKTGQVMLVAYDAAEEEIAALQEGSIQALLVQNPFQMGYRGVKAAVDAINKRPVEKRIDTGVMVVTMENFNQPDVQALLNPLATVAQP